MSDLFMDMHNRRRRCHNQQNTPPTSASPSVTTTSTSESPSSTQHINDRIFSHQRKNSTTDAEDASRNANYNFNKQGETTDIKHDESDDDVFGNLLSLKLRKPNHWKWELSTSKSCTNIALPRILLYDHKGQLLVDAKGDNGGIYKQEDVEKPKRDKSKKRTHQPRDHSARYPQRSATTNLTHSIRQALEKEFNGLHIEEATPSPKSNSVISISPHRSRKAIEFNTTDLPDYGISRRSSSLRGVRFNVENNEDQTLNESHIPEFLPTPPSTTTPTSSSSGPREKRKYRRSQSSGRSSAHSESILERLSYQKGRFSSPEYPDEKEVDNGPRYFLRTCNAGTLIVKEDSFNLHPRRRRRPVKNRSSESLQSVKRIPLYSSIEEQQNKSAYEISSPNDISCKKPQQSLRLYLSDENILENKQLTLSEEDVEVGQQTNDVSSRHLPKYIQARNQTKDLNYSDGVHQKGKVR